MRTDREVGHSKRSQSEQFVHVIRTPARAKMRAAFSSASASTFARYPGIVIDRDNHLWSVISVGLRRGMERNSQQKRT